MQDLAAVDAHCHVIAEDREAYPRNPIGGVESKWSQARPVGAADLIEAMDKAGIARAVVVQASTAYGHDNSYVADSVAAYPDRFSGVFSVDMMAPDAPEQLAYWQSRGLQGARLFTTGSTMPGQASWLADERSYPAWAWAEEHKLPLCVQMQPEGIPPLRDLLERFPAATVVLDHCARPDLSQGSPYDAARELFDLSRYEGVVLKVTERNLVASTKAPADPESFLGRLVLEFGAERLMWGSNFPAAEDDLPTLTETSRRITDFLSEDVRRQFFQGTADRLYPGGRVTPLRTVLADYPHVRDLKNGTLDGPPFEFIEVDPVHRAFPAMVREQAYDVCEMAIVTYLQARAEGKPLLLLPVVLRSRFQHDHLVCLADKPIGPGDLAGKRVGVRTYAQTTGVWLRGILADQYDVPLDEVQWVSIEDGHLAEFRDPEQVERAPEGSKLVEMLYAGELDAVIMGQDLPDDPRLVPVIPEPKAAAEDWYQRENAVPINHMVVVRADLAAERPGLMDDLYDLFARAKKNAPQPAGIDMTPIGLPANQRALELVTRYAYDQGLIPRRLAVSELFG